MTGASDPATVATRLGVAQVAALNWFAGGNAISVSLISGLRQQREAPRRSVQQSLVNRGLLSLTMLSGGWEVTITERGLAVVRELERNAQ